MYSCSGGKETSGRYTCGFGTVVDGERLGGLEKRACYHGDGFGYYVNVYNVRQITTSRSCILITSLPGTTKRAGIVTN